MDGPRGPDRRASASGAPHEEAAPHGGEREETEEEENEVQKVKVARNPGDPTKEEVEQHNVTHVPYRSWCHHCVRGRACGRQHREREAEVDDEEAPVPRVHLDYWYLTKADAEAKDEHEGKGKNPMIVMVDSGKKVMWTAAVGTRAG